MIDTRIERDHAMIVKVQLSLGTSDGVTTALIYNQDHSVWTEFEPGQDLLDAMGEDAKAYFIAILHQDGMLELTRRTKEQEW